MGNKDALRGLRNSVLVAALTALVQQGNEITGGVLAHLAELETRSLHLELGYSSLFAYCVSALGMSEGAAGRRVTASRVCRRFPEAFALVARGELHLLALCALAPYLEPANASEWFEASKRKPRRELEALIASRFPKPEVRAQIRRLTPHAQVEESTKEAEVASALANDPPAAASATTVALAPGLKIIANPAIDPDASRASEPRQRGKIEALSAERFGVHFTANADLRDLIERARALSSHRVPRGDLPSVMKLVFASFVERDEKRRFALVRSPRKAKRSRHRPNEAGIAVVGEAPAPSQVSETHLLDATRTTPGGVRTPNVHSETRSAADPPPRPQLGESSRRPKAAIRREVHTRDEGQCTFVAKDGRRCGTKAFLEFDHIEPWARSHDSSASNVRLRCRAHNQLHARNCFGAQHVATKIEGVRRGPER